MVGYVPRRFVVLEKISTTQVEIVYDFRDEVNEVNTTVCTGFRM